MLSIVRKVTCAVLRGFEWLVLTLANLPRGRNREWSRYRPWDLLKTHRIAARLHDNDAVLDIGCGSGQTLAMLSLFRTIRPHGVDIALYGGRFEHIPISVFDGRRLEFPDKTFDAAMLCYVMHHLTPDEAAALFAETVRVTRSTVFLIEDSLPEFGRLYRLRNRLHQVEAGLRYRAASGTYRTPATQSMFLTHDGWRTWLAKQPGVTSVDVEWLADVSSDDHHTLVAVTLATKSEIADAYPGSSASRTVTRGA